MAGGTPTTRRRGRCSSTSCKRAGRPARSATNAVDLKQIGRELNVRYVLEGSVQRSGNRTRVNVQLIDAETGNHLWAERFDKPLADLFDMQDESSRGWRAVQRPTSSRRGATRGTGTDPSLDGPLLSGFGLAQQGFYPRHYCASAQIFRPRADADPDNVDALIGSASADMTAGVLSFVADPIAAFAAAEPKLTKALSSVPDHARGHMLLGAVEIWTKRAAEGIALCEHALQLDRNLAHAHSTIGFGKILIGRAEETEAHIAEALRLSPRDTLAYIWMTHAGVAKLQLGSYEQAAACFRRSIEANRNYPTPYFLLATALAQLGRLDAGSFRRQGVPRAQPQLRHLTRPSRVDGDERPPHILGFG